MSDLGSPTVDCPHCDTALTPEPQGGGVYLCPCCGRTFAPEIVRLRDDAPRPSGRIRAQQRGKTRDDWE